MVKLAKVGGGVKYRAKCVTNVLIHASSGINVWHWFVIATMINGTDRRRPSDDGSEYFTECLCRLS